MAICEKFKKCPFYNDKMPCEIGIGAMFKQRYCEGDKTQCARYIVSTKCGPQAVDNSLYPNMMDRAKEIIAKNGKCI